MDSFMLRKGGTHIYIKYGLTFTNNLTATSVQVQTRPHLRLSLDLNTNLRTKNKLTDSYADARELADGAIAELKLVQISDEGILKRLAHQLMAMDDLPDEWILTIELEGTYDFRVRPDLDVAPGRILCLHVTSREP